MVMHKNALFIRNRNENYYFVRRVPNDMKSYYSSDRISFSLKTKSFVSALRITNTWNFIADYDIISMYLKFKVVTIIKGVL